jgi:hypothetical protein
MRFYTLLNFLRTELRIYNICSTKYVFVLVMYQMFVVTH